MKQLKSFKISTTSLKVVPADIQWPPTVEIIDLSYNDQLIRVETDAIVTATNLKRLSIFSPPPNVTFKTGSLRTEASTPLFELTIYDNQEDQYSGITFEDDAFGNVAGGHVWNELAIKAYDFGEGSFRVMLKNKFDSNADCKPCQSLNMKFTQFYNSN